ncbi:hypothetical protein AMS68_000281 [Peltaster fructicola]|uniref:DUF8035 domain-containing protein n=1 Tax=Peltaster fructicola TaxID=286661 RepID=A0A6H0XJ72_9PEZI|nr:hypothetical protein AMS68_000281 [Peltaster fructicola]
MSRRDYGRYDYDDRDRDYGRQGGRRDRDRSEVDIDIRESRSRGPERRTETIVLERDRRDDRRDDRSRVPDFLRDDYGKNVETQLVIREDTREDDNRSRLVGRRRSNESLARSRVPDRVVEKEEIIIREKERERDRRPPYPPSDIGRGEREEIVFRERPRSRAPPRRGEEEIDISIRRREDDERSIASPRSEVREREVEEIRIRRGEGERRPARREVVEEEEIKIRETRDSPPRRGGRDDVREEIDIKIRESDRLSAAPPPRSRSRVVATEKEEWIVRRPRKEPSPPPRDYEKEEIIIRRRERSISPEPPPREPSPEPLPPPIEPIVRPPIVQEVITHYRNIDHGFERAREPTPPPPPPSPPREREEDLEIAIRRTGTRNGKAYDEELIIEQDRKEREDTRVARRAPSVASPRRRFEEEEITSEADYYNRRATSRAYPGEAYNGATRKWELVDVPPGTERVRMDGIGGGAQEITWQRYNGERTSKFYADGRGYEQDYERRAPAPIPAPPVGRGEEKIEETRIERRTTIEERPLERPKTKDRMWTEVTKDLVIKEAIEESGYEYEENDEFYYVMEYLRYEDVLKLVELTEDIRRERRERIREIQWERDEIERAPKLLAPAPPPPVPAPPRSVYDERIYEREYIYDRDGRRYRRG